MEAGFDVHVPKPVDGETLLHVIEAAALAARGCAACGEMLSIPFPEHLRTCSKSEELRDQATKPREE